MISVDYVRLMAAYGDWQNNSLFLAASALSDAERRRDRGAFFGSIHATLNHLLWGDQIWMHRLAGTPAPAPKDIRSSLEMHAEWDALAADRKAMNQSVLDWAGRVRPEDLQGELGWYSGAMKAQISRPRWVLVMHMFNHGTHHRGQVHVMLTAAGAEPSDTDVPFMQSPHWRWG